MSETDAISSASEDEIIITPEMLTGEAIPADEELNWFRTAVPRDDEPTGGGTGRRRLRAEGEPNLNRDAKSGMPNIDEWMAFFGNVLIRLGTNFYVEMAFQGIDEEWLTDREIEHIKLTREERNRLARPFAEFAFKNRWTRKHGRSIIALGDSIDAMVQLGMWYARVNRIAAKYRPRKNQHPPNQRHSRRSAPPPPQPENRREEATDVSARQGQPVREEPAPNGHQPGWRPEVNGTVYPGSWNN
jgi:hypothetical protein